MPLDDYRRKRDFSATPEPEGSRPPHAHGALRFVVHKHAARALHYDLRLEIGGVYASWAIPKGPSLDPADKHLAVHVEDHPLEYGEFEGTIPKGEYGGGTVMIWDRGTFAPVGDAEKMVADGALKFTLEGTKLHGLFALVRMKPRPGEKRENWLLIKDRDESAKRHPDYDVTADEPDSVASGRTMDEIAASDTRWTGGLEGGPTTGSTAPAPKNEVGAVEAPFPADVAFQLATLVTEAPEGEGWLHEVKYDGYRLQAVLLDGKVRLRTRGDQDWTGRFAGLPEAIAALPARSALIDGEAVVFDADGRSRFELLQEAVSRKGGGTIVLAAFDLLYLDGFDLRRVALLRRKELLRALLAGANGPGPLLFSEHVVGRGRQFHSSVCDLRLEGCVSKRTDRPYAAGRTRDWLKVKCLQQQEFVIAGWTDPAGSRSAFGALLLGVHDEDGALRYAGRVGTGFTERTLSDVHTKLRELATTTSPLADPPRLKAAHWVRPTLVAEVAFREWTGQRILRQPAFLGLREDKKASEVVREIPLQADPGPAAKAEATAPAPTRGRTRDAGLAVDVAGTTITNPNKTLQPAGVTKEALARYYEKVGSAMLPHLANRLLTIFRCPHGEEGAPCFFQKHPESAGFPAVLRTVRVLDKEGPEVYFHADDLDGLLALAQLGALEIHTWNSLADDYEKPDRIVFDLDPGPGTTFGDVARAAHTVRDALASLDLTAFVKTTGGHGLHVVTPIEPERDFDEVREFAHALVSALAADDPAHFTAKMAKTSRPGRVFVDYLRNAHGATAVCAYSTRARPGAPVSVPVSWKELDAGLEPAAFDIDSVPQRMAAQKSDPWRGYEDGRGRVTAAVLDALGVPAKPGRGRGRTG
jgi:bifunctional non-homologous end joining protein LigD